MSDCKIFLLSQFVGEANDIDGHNIYLLISGSLVNELTELNLYHELTSVDSCYCN